MKKRLRLAGFAASLSCLSVQASEIPSSYSPPDATLELHAHLFMKQGEGWIFSGDFDGPLVAKDWRATNQSQVNPETLEQSGIGVLVASLAGYPVLRWSPREAVREQIALAERFVREHPSWIIAREPDELKTALVAGKRAIILALEPNILETDTDLDEFVERDGVRIVTFLHLIDDTNGGGALQPGWKAIASPLAWLFHHHRDPDGVKTNARGLTTTGRALAKKLIERGVWIDVAHASDTAARELIALMNEAGMPILISHTTLRRYLHAERGVSDWELQAVARSAGVIGLVPSEDMLANTKLPREACAMDCSQPCVGGIQALAQQWKEVAAIVESNAITLGSDYNDGLSHLHPACPVGTALDQSGLWNIGQVGAVWESLEKLGAPIPKPRRAIIDHFVESWTRVRAARKQ